MNTIKTPLRARRLLITACLLVFLTGCSTDDGTSPNTGSGSSAAEDGGTIKIVATTGHIADALRKITNGVDADIKLLCGPGIDPHSFSASTGDIQAIADADAVFYNGFHLEAKLHDLLHHQFVDKAWAMADAFPEDARLDWIEDGEQDPNAPFDPHIWNHLPGWSACVTALTEQMAERDGANAELYRTNGAEYVAEIEAAHNAALQQFEDIPAEKRVIVSAHDAFNYFARVYDFKSVAVLGIGNDAEADVRTMREVAEKVCDHKIPVIFIENITNPRVTEALQEACAARDWSVEIAEQPLYSDDLGSEPPTNSYLGAFKSNVDLIAGSLK